MESTKDKGNNKILFLILGLATVLIALIGATFAFFTAIVNNVNGDQSIMLTTQTILGVVYEADAPIVMPEAKPGMISKSSYTINNPNSSADATYKMELITDLNTFENTDGEGQLLITISGDNLSEDIIFDLTDGTNADKRLIADDIVLKAGKTDTYDVKVEFVELNKNQNSNMGKSYVGHIEVTQSIVTMSAD